MTGYAICSRLISAVALIGTSGLAVVPADARLPNPEKIEAAQWSVCMTRPVPSRANVRACEGALRAKHLSPFHHSLLLVARGEAHLRLAEYRLASADFTAALMDVPGDETATADRGAANEYLGRLDDADRDYTAAIARYRATPANRTNGTTDVLANLHVMRGRTRLIRDDPCDAIADLDEAVRLYPQGVTADVRRLRVMAYRASLGVHHACPIQEPPEGSAGAQR